MDIPSNWQWQSEIPEPGECALFDLDGVLADANGRQHYLAWPRRDWDGFFAAAVDDEVIHASAHLLDLLSKSLQIVVLTARPMAIRPVTVAWLADRGIDYDLLVMRPDHNRRPSSMFKREMLNDLRRAGFQPRIGFEDDIRNVEMLREEGVPCVYIHSGYYD